MLRISRAAYRDILADCDARRPEEACGFLLADGSGRVVRAIATENSWPDPAERLRRFSIEPLTQLRVERDADSAGLTLIGFYHSHPAGPGVPSEFDRSRAWPKYFYVIAGYSDGLCVEFRAWILDDGEAFVEHAVAIED